MPQVSPNWKGGGGGGGVSNDQCISLLLEMNNALLNISLYLMYFSDLCNNFDH